MKIIEKIKSFFEKKTVKQLETMILALCLTFVVIPDLVHVVLSFVAIGIVIDLFISFIKKYNFSFIITKKDNTKCIEC